MFADFLFPIALLLSLFNPLNLSFNPHYTSETILNKVTNDLLIAKSKDHFSYFT